MRTSESINDIASALAKAQGEMGNAAFNKTNPHFKSRYADLAAIRDATIPALAKNGLSLIQTVGSEGDLQVVYTRLIHLSGQWIESVYPLPVGNLKPQEMGSAITYAKRYSWGALCGIATEEDDDGNAAEASGVTTRAPVRAEPKQAAPKEDELTVFCKTIAARIKSARDVKDLDTIVAASGGDIAKVMELNAAYHKRILATIREREAELTGDVIMAG